MPDSVEVIALDDTPRAAILKMGEGNPGALTVLVELIHTLFDPDSAMKEMGPIVLMDSFGIRGENIWKLFRACGHNHTTMVALLRAVQMGEFPHADLMALIVHDRDRADLPTEAITAIEALREKLPNFKWDARIACPG